jgi:hypothetical protein
MDPAVAKVDGVRSSSIDNFTDAQCKTGLALRSNSHQEISLPDLQNM